ncbi:hypothetical protein EVG59_20730 [Salmonella enterica subsp. enterica serovar Dortmund]|nr:hypothetical protein [Salmonella enterica subsp. enterica serovar Dortmund]ECB1961621.1 hypothetical protein [Salmonella enterica subsp. enterica serovar Dortmund]ECE0501108.1 hypothetical protein [Salmonella enterica subsp. enterica]ECI3850805.1 hypothetical protein [Salmonella enterica subsp. enterica]ECI6123871.1 hypothetical protein [Salmonella enterica subsp. enterica]
MILYALATWRYSKGIYTTNPEVMQALIQTTVSTRLPVDVFLRLPEWCIYIKIPQMKMATNSAIWVLGHREL